ncbi:MAG: DUF1840 domain-containing protein [Thiolinea sp.]
MIRFTSKASASVSMFDKDAAAMLKMMGHSGTIPSAIRTQDVARYLENFENALKAAAEAELPLTYEADEDEPPVPVNRRAFPLLELMRKALAAEENVMWDHEHSVI